MCAAVNYLLPHMQSQSLLQISLSVAVEWLAILSLSTVVIDSALQSIPPQ